MARNSLVPECRQIYEVNILVWRCIYYVYTNGKEKLRNRVYKCISNGKKLMVPERRQIHGRNSVIACIYRVYTTGKKIGKIGT